MSTLYQNLMERMYDAALSDADNARQIGCSRSNISKWRKTKGYESRFKVIRLDYDKVKELNAVGYSDLEIARKIGASPQGVHNCLVRFNRRSNYGSFEEITQ